LAGGRNQRALEAGKADAQKEATMTLVQQIEKAADLVAGARYAVALTGAGISTPSGIPDFRSPGSGLWEKVNPMVVASIFAFRLQPQAFYNWLHPMADLFLNAQPNPAHRALADLENMGLLKAVITQNVDNLHQKAGSTKVYELHGHLREATCIRCHKIVPARSLIEKFIADAQVPRCECGGVMKPKVVLFGEQLPLDVLMAAQREAEACDLMLVAGSYLEVAPASGIPLLAKRRGARIITINYQLTYLEPSADVVIHEDVAVVLPKIVELASTQRQA
jgi:NAD-dependent deacetylase